MQPSDKLEPCDEGFLIEFIKYDINIQIIMISLKVHTILISHLSLQVLDTVQKVLSYAS